MADLSIHEIKIIETLIMQNGFIRTKGKRFHFLGKGEVFLRNSKDDPSDYDVYCTVPGKMIKHLYRSSKLLTCRQVSKFMWDDLSHYIYWEVYMPKIFDYECFKELQAQYAVGSVE